MGKQFQCRVVNCQALPYSLRMNTCGTCAEDEQALKDLFENVEIMKMMVKRLVEDG